MAQSCGQNHIDLVAISKAAFSDRVSKYIKKTEPSGSPAHSKRGGFRASNRFRNILGSLSDSRLVMVYKGVKISPGLANILVP